MGLMGLVAIYQKPNTSKLQPQHKVYPYLLRNLNIDRPNQVWCADITYIPMRRGFFYLVAIMDWHSRKILSWRLSSTMDTDFCVAALEEAPWSSMADRRSSTPTRAASSPVKLLPTPSRMPVSGSPWTARAAGWIT